MHVKYIVSVIVMALCLFAQPALCQFVIDWDAVQDAVEEGADWVFEQTGVDLREEFDMELVQQSFRRIEVAFQGEYVFDLALVREEAVWLLSVLREFDEIRPYAAWLATRMDYFDVLQQLIAPELLPPPARPAPEPRRPASPPPVVRPPRVKPANPAPKQQREAWNKKVAATPAPRGADRLVPGLKRVFAEHGTPEALVWLAEVESSFNPEARSPVGALGLFQFMPATAESMGLKLAPEDQRRDPGLSAAAAARYLNRLHGRFNNWPLALAAYNAGQGRVGGLLKKHNASTFDEIAVYLPAETQMYVPKIEAVLHRREGVALARLPGPTPRKR